MKKISLLLLAFLPIAIMAQEKSKRQQRLDKIKERQEKVKQLIKQEEEGALIFQKQSIFSFNLNSDGFNILFEKGKYKTIKKTNIWWAALGERKHPKEEKLTKSSIIIPGLPVGNPFVYGKQNNFYYFKLGFGQQRLIGGKSNKNGVAVSAVYGGGLSLGLLKPYYLEVEYPTTKKIVDVKYTGNDSVFLNPNQILGSSGFGKGFNEIKIIPGFHVRTALRFDYGRYNDLVSAIEVGLNVEYYTQKMPVMLLNKERQFFLNGYISIDFGKRK